MSYPPAPPPPEQPPYGSGGYGGEYGSPQPYGGGQGVPPSNNLVWGILTTIFCCLPFGIVSIVYAAQVNGKFYGGDHAGAQKSAANAKRWAIIAASAGVVVALAYVVFFVLLASSGMNY